MITPEIRKFIGKIANEHYELSSSDDKSMNFLWYLYSEGTHKDQYRPFIFAAEINLNLAMNIITHDESKNLFNMLSSPDKDNFYMLYTILKHYRKKRQKKYGVVYDSEAYKNVKKDYTVLMISPEMLSNTFNKTS
ncbi:MAG: hypothetical protein NTY55_02770 [Flavobacteriia bacterium]|nr:hypothetical protein [Flavobacteriia bacterium]